MAPDATIAIPEGDAENIEHLRRKAIRLRASAADARAFAGERSGLIAEELRERATRDEQGAALIDSAANEQEAFSVLRQRYVAAREAAGIPSGVRLHDVPDVPSEVLRLADECGIAAERLRDARRHWREIGEYLGTRTSVLVENNVED